MTFKALRQRAQLTQEALAAISGLEQTTISQIETGKVRSPRYDTVVVLARALGVSVEELAQSISQEAA